VMGDQIILIAGLWAVWLIVMLRPRQGEEREGKREIAKRVGWRKLQRLV
jgi:hypothetical protein